MTNIHKKFHINSMCTIGDFSMKFNKRGITQKVKNARVITLVHDTPSYNDKSTCEDSNQLDQ